ncbi:leucine-rich repeat protein [Plasmodium brasilianum]|uniref:Leucine-rich repeat protein n=3 Tax=Plasmodium (Plasmodium) TaxID=418103 RepID=A0A1D3JME0_PLAMA|nr:leucine-rich repeat protein [Plasmodium malariae]KAI4839309.1 leucine-rich repeat protein [Plasmodium brasilianum]SBT87722.1 leucine-rich repeat protein [Plasmodium malariae]
MTCSNVQGKGAESLEEKEGNEDAENKVEEDESMNVLNDRRVFTYIERTNEFDENYINIILNFKKLNIKSEQIFDDIVSANKISIIDDIKKAQKELERISRGKSNYHLYKKELTTQNNIENLKYDNSKHLSVIWELDLSFNYFTEISIDDILSILFKNDIIKEKGILHLNNLRALNLRKNYLNKVPYVCKYTLTQLRILCLSHNELGGLGNICQGNIAKEEGAEGEGVQENEAEVENMPVDEGILNENFPNLEHVYFQNNKIESFIFLKCLLNKHKKITHINISFNKISSFKSFPYLKNLKYFDLSFNTELLLYNDNEEDERRKREEITMEMEQQNIFNNKYFSLPLNYDKQDFLIYNFLMLLKHSFPNLQKINIKHTPTYSLIKHKINRENKNEFIYYPF